MKGVKKIVNILVLLYLLSAVLIFLGILNVGQQDNPGFYTNFFIAGGILLLLELLVENLYLLSLKREQAKSQQTINELKASLYDHQQQMQELRRKAETPPAQPAATTTHYSTATAPVSAAPTGTEPVPPVVNPVAPQTNPQPIITPSPTPGIQDPERRLPENTDT